MCYILYLRNLLLAQLKRTKSEINEAKLTNKAPTEIRRSMETSEASSAP